MLSAAGVVTALPLLAFAAAARRLPLSVLGVLQFISPSLQLVFGIVVFHEALTLNKLIGFGFIWLALVTFSAEGLWRARRRPT
jgi:chloramphenicol-sensitive protein RarD